MTNYFATAIYPLETPEEQNQKKKAAAAASSSSTTTATPWARARALNEESPARLAFARLMEYYCDCFGRSSCPPSIQRQMIDALKAGMTAKTICLCIDAAMEAERPTWAYAHAVIDRCIADGALTPQQFFQRSARQRGQKYSSDAAYYPRREELDSLPIDLFDD